MFSMPVYDSLDSFTINVDVYFELDETRVAASKIRPIIQPDGTLDDGSLSDYIAFVYQTIGYLEDAGLEIIEESESKSSKTSRYYTLADREQYESGTMKFVIFLRVSDHVPKLSKQQRAWIRQKREDTASKLHVKWEQRFITVNDAKYTDYDDACDEVDRLAVEYRNSLKNS